MGQNVGPNQVFIDLIGFGIVLPLVPNFSRNFGASEAFCGIIMASFLAMHLCAFQYTGLLGQS